MGEGEANDKALSEFFQMFDPAAAPAEPERRRAVIQRYEDALLGMPQADLPLFHHFASGVYVRELHIPADAYITGRIHKHDCLNIVPVGDIQVVTEQGNRRVQGPTVLWSPPGTKRAAYAFSATIWITVHANPTNERDGTSMADLLTVPSYEALEAYLLEPHRSE